MARPRWVSPGVLVGAMCMASGCTAAWECTAPEGEVVASGTLTCAEAREAGDQVLEQARARCAVDLDEPSCECAFVRGSCGGGRAND